MDMVGGPLVVTVIVVVAVLAVLFAVLHFGFHMFRRRKGRSRGKSGIMGDGRVEVLETTVIDAERRLVLVRCDQIEHLVMIGGPADLVVENDVRKVRGPGQAPAKIPGIETEKRPPAFQRPVTPAAAALETAMAAAPKSPESQRPAPRPMGEVRPAPAAARALPPIAPAHVRPGARNGEAHSDSLPRADDRPAALQRPQGVDPRYGRGAPAQRGFQASPGPVGRGNEPFRAAPAAPANDRNARPMKAAGRSEPPNALPAAQIPWSDPDSIENEIVRALRFDANTRGGQPAGRREAAPPPKAVDSATTLGDLADRLEEALAREVQSAGQHRRTEPEADDFGFDAAPAPEPERPKPALQKERQDRRERSEPARAATGPTPEQEPKREPPAPAERREEAPVISLNSRRRETADQLEDEMARLLGELTSDTKGR